jgi:capsular exopolysaccharide synthesis family protein
MSRIFQALERAERENAVYKQRREDSQATRIPGEPEAQQLSPPRVERAQERQRRRDADLDQPLAVETLQNINPRLVGLLAPEGVEAEQYRRICHTLEQLRREANLSVLAISSPIVGDGKTTSAINLAGTFAQFSRTRVLLIDLDLRRPSIAQFLDLKESNGPDVTNIILDPDLSWRRAIRRCPAFNLDILPAMQSMTAPHEILKSPHCGTLLQEARRYYDYVIVDTPPFIPVSDCQILQRWIDGFIMVIAAHRTPRKLIEKALQIVEPAKVVGLIFNNDAHPAHGYYSYYPYSPSSSEERKGWLRRAAQKFGSSS